MASRTAAIVSDGSELGGYALDLPLQANAMRGTWTVHVYTDPKGTAIGEKTFLVDDFVPDRIEFDMTSAGQADRVGTAGNDHRRRPISLWRAGRRARARRRSRPQADARKRGLQGLLLRAGRRGSDRGQPPCRSTACRRWTRTAKRRSTSTLRRPAVDHAVAERQRYCAHAGSRRPGRRALA